jgi:antitoxin (DNA-binding transcriptional repressor) of toxin-antitoxin stability system
MSTKITATELAKRLSEVLNRITYRGEEFVIERNGDAVAKLTSPDQPAGADLMEFIDEWRGVPRPDDGFADDLAHIHATQGVVERDLWPD